MPPVRRVVAMLRPAALGGAGVVVLVALLGPAAPAAAATTPCVGVVVDGRLTGGSVRTACATGDPRTGLDALTTAGIGYAFVPRQPGQVCQLDGVPACSDTGADTYWSYWWRAKGSHRWVYATTGAGTHDPEPGDTEAWVWQDGGKVEPPDVAFTTICPQAAISGGTRTTGPSPAARTSEPVDPPATGSPRTAGEGSGPSRTSRPRASSSSSSPASPSPAPSSPAATTSAPPASTAVPSPTTTSTASTPAPAASGSGGPPWIGLAVGAVLVGAVGGAAVVRARRGAS